MVKIEFEAETSKELHANILEFVNTRIVNSGQVPAVTEPDADPLDAGGDDEPKPQTAAEKKAAKAAEKKAIKAAAMKQAAAELAAKKSGEIGIEKVREVLMKIVEDEDLGGAEKAEEILLDAGGVESIGELRGPGFKAVYEAAVTLLGE